MTLRCEDLNMSLHKSAFMMSLVNSLPHLLMAWMQCPKHFLSTSLDSFLIASKSDHGEVYTWNALLLCHSLTSTILKWAHGPVSHRLQRWAHGPVFHRLWGEHMDLSLRSCRGELTEMHSSPLNLSLSIGLPSAHPQGPEAIAPWLSSGMLFLLLFSVTPLVSPSAWPQGRLTDLFPSKERQLLKVKQNLQLKSIM